MGNEQRVSITVDWRFWLTIIIQAGLMMVSYGRLDQRVSGISDQILELKMDMAKGYTKAEADKYETRAAKDTENLAARIYRLENSVYFSNNGNGVKK